MGIPAILAGESRYSGFEFTIEPQSKKEYFDILDDIGTVGSLTPKQVNKALIMMYIQETLIEI
ncbi:MAG: hypothetical protein ABEI86_10375, partial [Halobacteriaceae archaeon]